MIVHVPELTAAGVACFPAVYGSSDAVSQSLSVSLGFIAYDQSSVNKQPAPVHKWYRTAAGAEEDWRASRSPCPSSWVSAHWRGLDFFRMSVSRCLAKACQTQTEQWRLFFVPKNQKKKCFQAFKLIYSWSYSIHLLILASIKVIGSEEESI